jgi:hypothetical protein
LKIIEKEYFLKRPVKTIFKELQSSQKVVVLGVKWGSVFKVGGKAWPPGWVN